MNDDIHDGFHDYDFEKMSEEFPINGPLDLDETQPQTHEEISDEHTLDRRQEVKPQSPEEKARIPIFELMRVKEMINRELREFKGKLPPEEEGKRQQALDLLDQKIVEIAKELKVSLEMLQREYADKEFNRKHEAFYNAKPGEQYTLANLGNNDYRFEVSSHIDLDTDSPGIVLKNIDKYPGLIGEEGKIADGTVEDRKAFNSQSTRWGHPAYSVAQWNNFKLHRELVRDFEKQGSEITLLEMAFGDEGGLKVPKPKGKYRIVEIDEDKNSVRFYDTELPRSQGSFSRPLVDVIDYLKPTQSGSEKGGRRGKEEPERDIEDYRPVEFLMDGKWVSGNVAGFRGGKYNIVYSREGGRAVEKEIDRKNIRKSEE